MDTMLQAVPKDASVLKGARGTGLPDVKELDLGFGGFAPMPLNDAKATREQVLASEERIRAHHEAVARAAELERARASAPRECTDSQGNTWSYVLLDGKTVRIEGCEPVQSELAVPAFIEDVPVVALAPDAVSYKAELASIVVPDSVSSIGGCAFRGCAALRSAVLPADMADFSPDWFRGCSALEELSLPGLMAKIKPNVFDNGRLRRLRLGSALSEIEPGTFQKSQLEAVEVDASNPFICTDGKAIYDITGTELVCLAAPVASYSVAQGCRSIAKKAFCNMSLLKQVELPEGLALVGPYAFSRTSLASCVFPSSIREIGERAFFGCKQLERVELPEGLKTLAENCFTDTGISELRIPASIQQIGHPLASGCGLTFSGEGATCSIAEGDSVLEIDDQGGLYRKGEDGKRLLVCMDSERTSFELCPGTVRISKRAFAGHKKIERVVMHEGLKSIGAEAFRACNNLREVQIPDGLECIEENAFLETRLQSLYIPATLRKIGDGALDLYGPKNGREQTSLLSIVVDPANEKYFEETGLLLERWSNGRSRVLAAGLAGSVVRIPSHVASIAPYVFNGAKGVRELYLSDAVKQVGMRGLSFNCLIELIHIDLEQPIEGHTSFDIRFPNIDRSVQQIAFAFNGAECVSPASIYEHYDTVIIAGCNYDAKMNGGLGAYEQCKLIVERMKDPVFMTDTNRKQCDQILRQNIRAICADVARHDDRVIIDDLLDLGYLTQENIDDVIDGVAVVQDAAMTGHLLEIKRRFFKVDALDFEL